MARYELLDNVAHHDLRVDMRFGAGLGDAVGMVPAYPTEFAELQREYPIFFRRDADGGRFEAVALLGFDRDENLFVQDGRWNAGYLPGALARGPFLIGFRERQSDGGHRPAPVIHVDMDHPRIARGGDGLAVFLPQGGHTPYLEHVVTVLGGIDDGIEAGKSMYDAFDALGLIQPVELDVRLDESNGVHLTGLFGIDRERLSALDAAQLHGLHRAGWLEGVYLVLSSLHNMRRLIAEKQRRLRESPAAERAA